MERLTGLIGGVSLQKFKEISISFPSLDEQKRIVKILDKKFAQIDALKQNAQANLNNAKALFQSELEKVFNDNNEMEIVALKEVAKKMIAGGDAPKSNYSKEKTDKYQIPIYANAVAEKGLYGYTDKASIEEPSVTIAARGSGTAESKCK